MQKEKSLMSIYRAVTTCLLWLLLTLTGCKKFVDIDAPETKLTETNVYALDASAAAVLTGIYTGLSNGSIASGESGISIHAGLSADEFTYYESSGNTQFEDFYANALTAAATDSRIWSDCYKYINIANTALEGLAASSTLTPAVKQQLTGEALFIRAFLHFYLVNLYGDVPLVTSSDYRINNTIARSAAELVYRQIIEDLKSAQSLLSTDYRSSNITSSSTERVRPNQAVATALLARVYLYHKEWANAETEATKLISNTATYQLSGLNAIFSPSGTEAIWQLAPVILEMNTLDGQWFILNAAPDWGHPVSLSPSLLQAFETNDQRKTNWVGHINADNTDYYFPFKYKIAGGSPVVEYLTVLRLAEQYLIRSEARAQLTKLADARDDLNAVRERAGLSPSTENDQQLLLNQVYRERRVELFSEWGHRWLDLKRTNQADGVMAIATAQKGGVWKSTAQLYPIPQGDINRDPKLTQNLGY